MVELVKVEAFQAGRSAPSNGMWKRMQPKLINSKELDYSTLITKDISTPLLMIEQLDTDK